MKKINNIKIKGVTSKGVALIMAGFFAATNLVQSLIPARAEEIKEDNTRVEQKYDDHTTLTVNSFKDSVEDSYERWNKRTPFAHLHQDTECLAYLLDLDYMTKEVKSDIYGYINPNKLSEESINAYIASGYTFNIEDGSAYQLMGRAYEFINQIMTYFQNGVRKGIIDESVIDDLASLCFDEHDQETVREIARSYVKAFNNGNFDKEAFNNLFLQLTSKSDTARVSTLSVGPELLILNVIGVGSMQGLQDYFTENFTKEEIYMFFDKAARNKEQWAQNPDYDFNYECLSEKEVYVLMWTQLRVLAIEEVNNNILYALQSGHQACK